MIYIFNKKLKKKKKIQIALTDIYGINKSLSLKICRILGYSKNFQLTNLNKEQILYLTIFIEQLNIKITNSLKKSKYLYIKHLIDIKSFRGMRLVKGLPVRGQRTRTNAKTCLKFKQI